MQCSEFWIFLFCLGQLVLLTLIARKWSISRNDIFPTQRTSIYQTFSRCQPIFQLAQRLVVDLSTGFQPRKHELLLGSVGIDSIGKIYCQHDSTIAQTDSRISCCAFVYWSGCNEDAKTLASDPAPPSGARECAQIGTRHWLDISASFIAWDLPRHLKLNYTKLFAVYTFQESEILVGKTEKLTHPKD